MADGTDSIDSGFCGKFVGTHGIAPPGTEVAGCLGSAGGCNLVLKLSMGGKTVLPSGVWTGYKETFADGA